MLNKFAQLLIRGYQRVISPFIPRTCRFHPTCSAYGAEAIKTHGVLKGGALALWRIMRCNPWHKADYDDPVP